MQGELPLRRETGSKWHRHDWGKVMSGETVADKLFLRRFLATNLVILSLCRLLRVVSFLNSGLIRKDLLPRFAGRSTPPTWLCNSIEQVRASMIIQRYVIILTCLCLPIPASFILSSAMGSFPVRKMTTTTTMLMTRTA